MSIVLHDFYIMGVPVRRAILLDNEIGTTDGEWVQVAGLCPISFEFDGVNGETIQLCATNKLNKPANDTHGRQIGVDITASGLWSLTYPVAWVKARVTGNGSGTVNCYMMAIASGGK